MSAEDDHSLDGAYALQTPEDSVKLYRGWAETYDTQFAESHNYIVPEQAAAIFREHGGQGPILDIGAGTGLVGEELTGFEVDAIDISQEMLDVAARKGVYRNLMKADLTQPLALEDGRYHGFISTGTFTHGHVGPVCLPELLRIARPDALFVLSINAEVYDGAGFGSAFAELVAESAITPIDYRHIPYYRDATHDHANDMGLVAIFRRR